MRCVYEIKRIVAMEETQLLVCLSFLLEIEAISLIDMFDVCNVYFLQDFESIWKEDVLTELYLLATGSWTQSRLSEHGGRNRGWQCRRFR